MNDTPPILAIPTLYRGILMRSGLEADWAYNLDVLDIKWSYEPYAVRIRPAVNYLCDFYLPELNTWLEVKGPHNKRVHKTRAFHDMQADSDDPRAALVVVGRVSVLGCLTWHGADPASQDIVIASHDGCKRYYFGDLNGAWQCRWCFGHSPHHGTTYASGTFTHWRAPRDTVA